MAFSFTSIVVEVDNKIMNDQGPYSFRIHGAFHHKMSPLHPREGWWHFYAQLYIYDEQAALAVCNSHNLNLNHILMGELQDMLKSINPFVPLYKQAYQVMCDSIAESQPNL